MSFDANETLALRIELLDLMRQERSISKKIKDLECKIYCIENPKDCERTEYLMQEQAPAMNKLIDDFMSIIEAPIAEG